ncbi:uncharacterized protein LOC141586753 [Silene latifolia]|uniref:uncharacterized protein LOC141586753 n=1 Tax=Silene latifolia TaxID=37657 RepID=UPI003D77EC9B
MSFLNKGFKASKCKTQLKLTIPRIKLLRNRKEFQLKQMRKDIAKLLEAGQEATARIRVEHIIREENMMAAQEIIELFCELISVRLPIIETQRECPLDLKEAISSICFAAPRCAELPELQQVQLAFVSKYGKEFVASASALMPDCGVNRQLIELLSVRAPSPEKKLNLLKEIAEEHDLNWDPAPSETELFKSHEDLLNGPTQFVSGFKAPLPKENDEILHSTLVHTEFKEDSDELESPQVPKVSLWPSAKEDMHPSSGMPVESLGPTQFVGGFEAPLPKENDEILQSTVVHTESKEDFEELEFPEAPKVSLWSSAKEDMHPSSGMTGGSSGPTQFVSGLKPPLPKENDEILQSTVVHTESKQDFDELEFPEVPKVSLWPSAKEDMDPSPGMPIESLAADHESPKSSANTGISKQFVPFISPPSMSLASAPVQEITQPSKPLRTKSTANVDLNDILAAAKAAAESADRAAVAARAAANLVELRVFELIESRSGHSIDMGVENPFHASDSEMEKLQVGDNPSSPADHFGNTHIESASKDGVDGVTEPKTSLPAENSYIKSVNNESMFSYPNLFSPRSPGTHAPETTIGHE